MRHRKRIKLTGDWDQLVPLFEWPEQEEYERIRQPVLFGSPLAERAKEIGVPERTLYFKIERFEKEGIRGLFSTKGAKRQILAPVIRGMIVDLKAEHPAFNDGEITNIVYVRTGRRLKDHTAERRRKPERRELATRAQAVGGRVKRLVRRLLRTFIPVMFALNTRHE